MKPLPPRLAQGQAGVHAVAAQLLLRGLNPAFPSVDRGADIVTDSGVRIQVKCSYRRRSMYGGSYHFCLGSGVTKYTAGNGYRKGQRPPRNFSETCDLFVFWGIDDNRFWIVPSQMLDGFDTVVMVGAETPWLKIDEARVLEDGKTMNDRQIAAKYGVSPSTIGRVMAHQRPYRTDERTQFSRTLLAHENKWELISEFKSEVAQPEQTCNDIVVSITSKTSA